MESTGAKNRTITDNKPDIITHDNVRETCVLVDVADSGERNVIKKEAEKILNIKTLKQKYSICGM
jgi:hypothetical protein